MANISERKDKDGNIVSYRIRVARGYDTTGNKLKPYEMTYKPALGMTSKQIEKELNKTAVQFEEQCKKGYSLDNKQALSEYAEYVIELKRRSGAKHKTIESYRYLLKRINIALGHIKLCDIRPQHLNEFYAQLSQDGIKEQRSVCTVKLNIDLKAEIKARYSNRDKFAELIRIGSATIDNAINGKNIQTDKAELISNALGKPLSRLFIIEDKKERLSPKTIQEYHRLISTILNQAEKEMLVEYNAAKKATPPKYRPKSAEFFQPEQIEAIRDSLEQVEIKWKSLVHLLLISGSRRGEIAGLKWSAIDFKNNQIHINNNLLYSSDWGMYQDTTKTEESTRFIKLPAETMEMLKAYRKWWIGFRNSCGTEWNSFIQIADKDGIIQTEKADFLYIQTGSNAKFGYPMSPDTINSWLIEFSKKNNLPHINPHKFRHSHASILYFAGVDSVSISKRLGHSKVSTTSDIYSHIIKEADERSAECVAEAIYRTKKA